jgi:hypothetical protein
VSRVYVGGGLDPVVDAGRLPQAQGRKTKKESPCPRRTGWCPTRLRKRELLEPEAALTEQEMASLAEVDELEDPGPGEPSREGLADDGERDSRDERELIAALACAGDTTFGPCMPGLSGLGARPRRRAA